MPLHRAPLRCLHGMERRPQIALMLPRFPGAARDSAPRVSSVAPAECLAGSDSPRRHGYVFIEFYPAVADQDGKLRRDFTEDGLHCTPAGYAVLKPLVEKALTELR